MYTRSRQSQNFTGNQQQQRGGNMQQQQREYQQQPYNQHGNYQGGNQNQQNYNQGGGGTPVRQQPQQQQQGGPQQHSTPQPQRLKPILKSSGGNVQGTPNQGQNQQFNQNQQQNFTPQQQQQPQQQQPQQQQQQQQQQTNNGVDPKDIQNESMDSDVQDVPKWRRKIPGLKVNRKLKRLRMNQRLRRTIQPKNAIMVLNEMKTGVQFTFPETQAALPNSLFLVHAEIEGKTYIGQGISKPLARQNAAENALKSLLLEKMTAAAMKARIDAETENVANPNNAAVVVAAEGTENKEGETNMETEEADEIPWSSLASFALYKLFLEWQNQGTVVPVPRPGVNLAGKVKKEQPVVKPVVQKELPPNPTTIHPVMLLNQMRPGLTYHEVSRVGNPPNTMFTLGVTVDDQEFTGAAKNKKDAKKMAAKSALHGLYNLVYPEEKEGEDVNMG